MQHLSGNIYRVTLSNILNLFTGFNITDMDIIVHEPYKNCSWTSGPYNRQMVPYEIGTNLVSTSYTSPPPCNPGQRHYTVTGVGAGNFGNVVFDIITSGPGPVNGCPFVFPINVVFRDNTRQCTLCERTFYFYVDHKFSVSLVEDH